MNELVPRSAPLSQRVARGDEYRGRVERVKAAIPEHAREKPIELWWQDDARVGQQGTLTRVWAERSNRPPAPLDQRREWAYIFGAVCPRCDIGAALVLPYANPIRRSLRRAKSRRANLHKPRRPLEARRSRPIWLCASWSLIHSAASVETIATAPRPMPQSKV